MKFLLFGFFGVLLPLVMGYAILLAIYKKKGIPFSLLETIVYSLLLGIGFHTIYMFFLGWVGIDYSLLTTTLIYVAVVPFLIRVLMYRKKHTFSFYAPVRMFFPKNIYKKILSIAFMLFVGRNIYSSFFIVLNTPTYPDDAFVNRNFRSKVFYATKRLNYDKPNEARLFNGGFAVDYPMFNPLFKSYSAFAIREYDDRWTNAIAPLMNLLVVLMILGYFTRKYSLFAGFASAAAYTFIPQIVIHSFNTYAEIGLIAYLIPLVFLLYDYFKEHGKEKIVLASFLLMFLGWIKNEGLFVFGLGMLLAFIITTALRSWFDKHKDSSTISSRATLSKNDIVDIIKLGLPTVIFYIIRKSYLLIYNIRDVIGFGSTAKMSEGFSIQYQGAALVGMRTIVFTFGGLNIVPLMFVFSLLLFGRSILRNMSYSFLALSVIIPFAIMFFFFIFTSLFSQSMTTGDTRQFMVLIALALMFLLIIFNDYFTPHTAAGTSE